MKQLILQILNEVDPADVAKRLKDSGRWDNAFHSSGTNAAGSQLYGVFRRSLGEWEGRGNFHGIHTSLADAKLHAEKLSGQPDDHYNNDLGIVAELHIGDPTKKTVTWRNPPPDSHGHLIHKVVGAAFPASIFNGDLHTVIQKIAPNTFHHMDDLPHDWYKEHANRIVGRDD